MAEKEKKLEYKPQQKVQTPTYTGLSDDVTKTGEEYSSGSSRQSSNSSSFQATEQSGHSDSRSKVTFDPNAIKELNANKGVYGDLLAKSHTINADDDSVLRKIGQMRRERERTLKDNLRRSAGREARKLKYNAWTNFLTSLGNIAGLGNAAPIKIDNARTVESFNRLQDMYDAAANLQNDPTLTWLDKENLSRMAAIEAYNAQAKQNDVSAENALLSNAASRVGYEQQTTGDTRSSGTTVGGSSSYQAGVQSGIKQEGITPEGAAIKAAKSGEENEYAVLIGGGAGVPASGLKGLSKAEALFMVTDALEARKANGVSNATGVDVSKLLGDSIEYTHKGKKKKYNTSNAKDIDLLLAAVMGNTGESQVAINAIASKLDKRDTEGVYYKYFNNVEQDKGTGFDNDFDGEV